MIRHFIVKTIVVLTFVCIGIVALAVVGIVGYFFLALAFPRRMNVTGSVTDSGGIPMQRVEVRAVPLAEYDAHREDCLTEPRDKKHIAVTDENGRYQFKRLVASGGVKEGMWVQEYDIKVKAEGYKTQTIRVRNDFEKHEDVIKLADFVLEKERPDDKVGSMQFDSLGKDSGMVKRPAAAG